MKEQQPIQQLVTKNNSQHPPSIPPNYALKSLENQGDEWNLQQILAFVRRRAIVIGGVAIAISSTIWFTTLSRQASYEGKFQLLVEPVTAETQLAQLTPDSQANTNSQEAGLDYSTQIQVLQSPKLIAPIIKQINTRYPDINYYSLIPNLTLTRFQETKILEVRYQDSDPQKVKFILDLLARGYLKYSLQERQTNLSQGIQFVDSQQPMLQARVNGLQTQLQNFRQKYNFIDPSAKAEQLSEQLNTIKLQQLDTQKQLAETRSFYQIVQSQSGEPQVLNESPAYQKLVDQLRQLESQIDVELIRFQEDSPTIQALQQKREKLLPLVQQEARRVLVNKKLELENQISVLQVRANQLAKAESNLTQQIKQAPSLARQYADLQRELNIATESLNRFLEKRQSLEIETAQKEVPWELIVAPELPEPIDTDVKRGLILGAIAGLLGGVGAALLLEKLNKVFHSPDELKEVTKLPLLGMIPFHKHIQKPALVAKTAIETKQSGYNPVVHTISNAQDKSYFPFLEAFRSLNINVRFLGSDTPINSFVISSALHAEGKSTVAAHLAQAAAAMGQKVLIVDADLRLPQIHSLFDLPNEPGLSNVISTNLPVLEAIQRSPWDNLFVLTAGYIPPDPTKLLSSKKLQNIMEQLRHKFDLIIYDTPPLLSLVDSNLVASHTDGIILVVLMDKTDRSVFMHALDRLKLSPTNVLGTVCNGLKNYNTHTPYSY
ncbi:MAG: polysaccharide biosynthesis tyrosine autokinase [Gloeocapsa sp. UFS-A4-WI-NPMV-4B04]|jgi:capsular exopolysaccharide synthesis family protein|nr:polysaccharide biosynthesis tyrosine autokinase [Gloeocapsa sp. UFS-A4-WI-NPMV-4B04]